MIFESVRERNLKIIEIRVALTILSNYSSIWWAGIPALGAFYL
ncbi:MAG: hypothetical protein ACUVUG_05345 [Candidatus Aminicenantia bacterium]